MSHSPLHRITEIDGLRAWSVAVVIASHLLTTSVPGGGVGVAVFFVISGYVITAGLMKDWSNNRRIDLRSFYLRRVFRLWPALWAMVLFVFLAGAAGGKFFVFDTLAAILSYMNWIRAFEISGGGPLGHTWSLAIEEQFYLFWPICFLYLMKKPRHAPLFLIAAFVAFVAWRSWMSLNDASIARLYNGTDTRLDGLILGCLAAMAKWRLPDRLQFLWPVPLAYLGWIAASDSAGPMFGYALVSIASLWLVLVAVGPQTILHKLLNGPVSQWGGSRSYSLYLWHFPLILIVERLPLPGAVRLAVVVPVILVAGELSYRFIEQRFRIRTVKSSGSVSGISRADLPLIAKNPVAGDRNT